MLYVANLHRDGLLSVGVTDRPRRRRTELRRTLSAPKLSYIIEIDLPWGWGDELEWGSRLHAALRQNSSRLQLFSEAELTEEVVDASPQDAHRELGRMLLETAVDSSSGAYGLPIDKVDWRFRDFVRDAYPDAEFSPRRFFSGSVASQLRAGNGLCRDILAPKSMRWDPCIRVCLLDAWKIPSLCSGMTAARAKPTFNTFVFSSQRRI